jgi:hypothetical protein
MGRFGASPISKRCDACFAIEQAAFGAWRPQRRRLNLALRAAARVALSPEVLDQLLEDDRIAIGACRASAGAVNAVMLADGLA